MDAVRQWRRQRDPYRVGEATAFPPTDSSVRLPVRSVDPASPPAKYASTCRQQKGTTMPSRIRTCRGQRSLAVGVTVLAGVLVLSTALPASAGTRWLPGAWPIVSSHGGKCLDAAVDAPFHNGTVVQVWRCNGWANQKWSLGPDGTIRSVLGGGSWCLDADLGSPTHNGTRAQLWRCNGMTNQKWSPRLDGTVHSVQDGGSWCLDEAVDSTVVNGTRVQVWRCNGWDNQKWHQNQTVLFD
jgi:hypothetical protein